MICCFVISVILNQIDLKNKIGFYDHVRKTILLAFFYKIKIKKCFKNKLPEQCAQICVINNK